MSKHQTKYEVTGRMIQGKRVDMKMTTVAHRPGQGFIYRAVGPARDPKVMTCRECYPPQKPIDNPKTRG